MIATTPSGSTTPLCENRDVAEATSAIGKPWPAVWVVLGTALAVSAWLLFRIRGQDLVFHTSSWFDVARQWRDGILWPRWCQAANFGYGDPRFVFYPPLSWMLGGALASVLPARFVPFAFVFIAVAVSGASMFRCASTWWGRDRALWAAVFYAANPYHFVLIYWRAAYAELLASAILPLVVLYAVRIGIAERRTRAVVGFSIAFAAICLADIPAAILAGYAVAAIAIFLSVRMRSISPVLMTGVAAITGLGLISAYLLPAYVEQVRISIDQAVTVPFPASAFLFQFGLQDVDFSLVLGAIAAGLFGACCVALFTTRTATGAQRLLRGVLFVVMAMSTVMMFRPTLLVWRTLPFLPVVQFSFRWLLLLAFTAGLTAGAMADMRTARRVAIGAGLSVATAAITFAHCHWDQLIVIDGLQQQVQRLGAEANVWEYMPRTLKLSELRLDAPRVRVVGSGSSGDLVGLELASQIRFRGLMPNGPNTRLDHWDAKHIRVISTLANASELEFRLTSYPAWRVTVDGVETVSKAGPSGLKQVHVTPGTHTVDLHYREGPDLRTGILLSGAFAALIICWTACAFRWQGHSR